MTLDHLREIALIQISQSQRTVKMRDFSYVIDADLRKHLEISEQRGAFQGWIGNYAVYQKDGATHGFHQDNKGTEPDYTGSEAGLYPFAGVKPIEIASRF